MAVIWFWSGALTDDGAVVATKIDGGTARVLVADNEEMSGGAFYTATATTDQVFKATITGLAPKTQYWYQVEDESVLDTSKTGRFRTAGPIGQPDSFTFGAASCAGAGTSYPAGFGALVPDRISNHPVFDEIRSADPDFFIHTGDFQYYNLGADQFGIVGGGSLDNFRRAYDDVLIHCDRQAKLYRNVPIFRVWDDHDYGPNNSDGTFVDKANGAQVYRELDPHYPLVEPSGAIYHSFQRGRVLFVMLDSRYERQAPSDPSPRTYLGSAQKTWLDGLLAAPPAGTEFLVVVSPQPIVSNGSTSWGSYDEERQEVYTMFADHGWIGRSFMISGDQHQFGWDSGSHTNGFPLYVMSPLDSPAGIAGRAYDLGTRADRGQWGLFRIDDYGTSFRVRAQGMVTNPDAATSSIWQTHTWYTTEPVTRLPVLRLDYALGHISEPFEPAEDDERLRNDVTAERVDGSTARYALEEGPLSTQPPPDGAGLYDERVSLNVAADNDLIDQAAWRVHLGTVDEPRYPTVTVDLTRNPDIAAEVGQVESGDRMIIDNPPPDTPPGDIDSIAQGYSEEITPHKWKWTANTTPASPWTVGVVGDDVLGRLDTDGSELAAAITDVQTTFDVATTAIAPWVDTTGYPDEFPFDVRIGGEVMTVTAITGTVSPQTFTVVRSVNGIVKAHAAGTDVRLAQPLIIAL